MIGRLVWYAFLLAAAAVTAMVQIDRQSAVNPHFASLTPQPVRGFAQAQLARRAIVSGTGVRAVAEAQLLVDRRPIPAESLRTLAQAQFKAGQVDAGFVTIQMAAQRGWRDPAAQEAMLRLAVAAGDEAEAARRYTALFLQNRTEDALLVEFGEQLFADPGGQAAQTLIKIVAGTDRWSTQFLQRGARVIPAQSFSATVLEADKRGARFECTALSAIAPGLERREAAAGAQLAELVRSRC